MVRLEPSTFGEAGHSPSAPNSALVSSILFDRSASSHAAVICADSAASFSYAELARLATDLAAGLQQKSLRPRDRAAILLPTSVEFAAAFFGALMADAIAMPVDIHLKKADLLEIIDLTKPRILITNPGLYRKIGSDLGQLAVCLLEFDESFSVSFVDPGTGTPSASSLGERATRTISRLVPVARPEDDAVFILSSGTTGLPKAVRLSHRAILRNISMHWESLGIEEDIRGLQLLPMNYSYGLIASFLSILHNGGTAVLLPAPEPASVLAALHQYEVNLVMGTPALFRYLIEKSPTGSPFTTSPVRYLTVGGDRCKRHELDLIHTRLSSAKTYVTYGLTEAGPRVSTLPHQLVKELPQSVGLPLRGVEVFILDGSGRRRAPRETGEIVVKTPSLMNGYFGDLERTRTVVRDGLCHTGDIGYLDDRGFLYCLGRKDRQFKFGGRMVNPSLIEQCLAAHPLVKEVAVVKIDSERDEFICAKIRAAHDRKEDLLPELRRHCRRRLPSYLIPQEFRFQDNDQYYHKGKLLNLAGEPLPDEPTGAKSQHEIT